MVQAAIDGNWHVIRRHKAALREVTAAIIADGVRTGEFDVADPTLAALCFQHAMMSSLHPLIVEHRLREGEDIEAMIEPMLAFSFRALGAGDSTSGSYPPCLRNATAIPIAVARLLPLRKPAHAVALFQVCCSLASSVPHRRGSHIRDTREQLTKGVATREITGNVFR